MDNYICIDGEKIELNDSQISTLRAALEKNETKKSPFFERQSLGNKYYYINTSGELSNAAEMGDSYDLIRYDNANYCANEELLKQRALEEILARRLWRYSMEHDGDKINWSRDIAKYYIYYDVTDKMFYTYRIYTSKDLGVIYFYDEMTAEKAIEEVVKPFMKEYPGFKNYNAC